MAVDKNKLEDEASIHRFYKIVLSWDYLRLLNESGKNKKKIGDGSVLGLTQVKNTYKDVDDYTATFEPLLFEEVKAQILQGRDEEEETEWTTCIVLECSEDDCFHLAMVFCDHGASISQNDLLLISTKKFGEAKELPTTYAFALVEHRQGDKIRLRMNLSGEVNQLNTTQVETCPRLLNMCSVVGQVNKPLHILKKVYGVWCYLHRYSISGKNMPLLSLAGISVGNKNYARRICSLSSIAREYVALRSVSSLPFRDLILTAAESNYSTEDRAWKISKPLMEFIRGNHNPSQLEAIHPVARIQLLLTVGYHRFYGTYQAGLSRKTFVLIQGPPGTGKTQTILGLLSAILHATPARVHSDKGKMCGIKREPELPIHEKYVLVLFFFFINIALDSFLFIEDDLNGFFCCVGTPFIHAFSLFPYIFCIAIVSRFGCKWGLDFGIMQHLVDLTRAWLWKVSKVGILLGRRKVLEIMYEQRLVIA
ncbi:unnamed protein product [Ilex paraguariensis]|uniref:DNA2/NAM7 helicase helicase domain-containing protein n=1 Tax=Ilex paraguariensis TaxID=185542 RepID=A0ABC8S1V9_9AQUA